MAEKEVRKDTPHQKLQQVGPTIFKLKRVVWEMLKDRVVEDTRVQRRVHSVPLHAKYLAQLHSEEYVTLLVKRTTARINRINPACSRWSEARRI